LVERGDRVKAGEIAARLDSEQEVRAAETARLRADFRRKEAERLQDLRDTDAIPEREYVSALTEYEIAKLEHAQAESLLKRRSIRSPVDGVVVDITMFRGEYVHKQATMMTIAEIDPLYIEVFMPVSEYESVQPGMPAIVSPEFPIGGNFDAQVAVVDSVFDAASRTFRIRLILQNDDYALPAGLRCTVRFLRADGRP
jgi:RND family efflux transporter MFP subunit